MDTNQQLYVPDRTNLSQSQAKRLDDTHGVMARLLRLYPGLRSVPPEPHWSTMVRNIGLTDKRAFQYMVWTEIAREGGRPPPIRSRRPSGVPHPTTFELVKRHVDEEEEKRAEVVKVIAPAQEIVISAVSDTHRSATVTDRTTLLVPQYNLGPPSLQAGGGSPMLADVSHTHMEFIATRGVPRELALLHKPDKLFIVRVLTRAMEPYYNRGEYLLVEATESVDLPDVHVIFETDSGQFMLVYAKPLRDGSGMVEIHGNIKMEQLGIDKPTIEHASRLAVRGRVHDAIPKEVAAPWLAANGNGKVNTSEVAC